MQVSSTEDTMVFHITGNILCAGAVHSRMHFHVGVNNVQIDFLILKRGHKGKAFFFPLFILVTTCLIAGGHRDRVLNIEIAGMWQSNP